MRVALCISGAAREFKTSYASLKEKVLDKLNPDIFISTWDWRAKEKDIQGKIEGNLDEFYNLYKPKLFETEIWDENTEKSLRIKELAGKYSNILLRSPPMYYKIWKATNLALNYSFINHFTYDVVIRTRSDLEYFTEISEGELKDVAENPENQILYARKDILNPINAVPYPNHVQDHVFFGAAKTMKNASMTIFGLEEFYPTLEKLSPELFLRECCRASNIEIKDSNMRYKLCRENFTYNHKNNEVIWN